MKHLLTFFFFLIPFFLSAQENKNKGAASIKGIVETADEQPAAYVSVLIKSLGKRTITDEKGYFEIGNIVPGTYIIYVSLSGYTEREITVPIKQNDTALKIQLQQTYAELKNIVLEVSKQQKYVETKTSQGLRLNLPLIEIPQNIQITSRHLLSDQGLVSMTEALRTVSGIQKVAGGLNDYELIVRGTDEQFNVLRNGVGGFWWGQQEDAAMLEKIEFIKGPAGFLMSMVEPGGIVNNVTKQPVKERLANVNSNFGSYNLFRFTTDLGGTLSKKSNLFYRFNAGIHRQERAFQFSKAYRYFICGAMTYDLNKKTSVTAEYNNMYGKTSGNNEGVPSLNGQLFALPGNFTVADAKTDHYSVSDKYYRVQLKHDFNDNWHLNMQAAYVHGYGSNHFIYADESIPVTNDTLYRYFEFSNWYNFSKVLQAFIDGRFYTGKKFEHKVLAGIDYCNAYVSRLPRGIFDQKKLGLYIPNLDYYINPDTLNNFNVDPLIEFRMGWFALYLQDHIKIADKLVVTLAGHFTHSYIKWSGWDSIPDYQRNTKYDVFTPRVGLTWLFSEDLSAYALYDQCFVPPNMTPQIVENIQNTPFKPVTGFNIESGLKSSFLSKKLYLNFSIYHIVKNNTLTEDPKNREYDIQRGQVTSNGIDFDITGNLIPAITLNANYAYVDARITKDSDSLLVGTKNFGVPDHCANFWMNYKFLTKKFKGLSLGLGYQYMGHRAALSDDEPGENVYLPVYKLLDAAISYHNEKFNIGLNIYNITNKQYATMGFYKPSSDEWRYTPGEPTNFRLSFGVNLVQNKKSHSK
jgi:iron complex outermembrane receptor protein